MKTKWCVLVYLLAATLVRAQTNNLTALLQRGLFEEQANRNLDAAIADYQSIAARFDKDRQLAATAIFRLGECYRMQGKTNEAVVQYQRVLREFPEEKAFGTLSRQNLTALGRTPETRTASSENADAFEKAAATAEAEAVSLKAQLDQLKHLSKDELQAVVLQNYPNPLLTKLTQQLSDAEQNLIKMSMDMTTNNPRYIAAEKVIRKIHQEIDAQLEGTLKGMQVKVDTALATAKSLRAQAGQPSAMPAGKAASIRTDPEDQKIQDYRQMLQNSPDLINAAVSGGGTPLWSAAWSGQLKVARFLLDHGANVNSGGNGQFSHSPLIGAALQGHKAMVALLLSRGAQVNATGWNGQTALHVAVSKGFLSVTQVLLANKANVNAGDDSGKTPLDLAAQNGQVELVKMLLAAGAKPNLENDLGRTSLSYAAASGSLETMRLLLTARADPDGGKLDAPLLSAVHSRDVAAAELFLENGADPNAKGIVDWPSQGWGFSNGRGWATPLWLATITKQPALVKLLLKFKADPNSPHTEGPPLLFSVLSQPELLAAFIDAGAKVDARDTRGGDRTPLDAAASSSDAAAVETLLQHGANPNSLDAKGNTPLHYAASGLAKPKIFELLFAHNSNPNVRNTSGWAPLDLLQQREQEVHTREQRALAGQLVDWLLRHGALEHLPHWNQIRVSRSATRFSTPVFQRSTNDWNQFTLFETVLHYYRSSQTYQVYQRTGTWAGYPANSMMPFPDLTRVTVLRPSRASTNETRIVFNLLNPTNGVDCARDTPLKFGDVVEIPVREHTLAERDTLSPGVLAAMANCLKAKAGQAELVVVGGQTIEVPLKDFEPHDGYVGNVLKSPLAQGVLTSDSDLSRVKVIRQNPITGKQREWILNCSPHGSPAVAPPSFIPLRSISSRLNEGNSQLTSGLWLRNGDVIEVPEK